MPLHQRPYCSACGFILSLIGWHLMFPFYWSVNMLLSCFLLTSKEISRREEEPCYERPLLLTLIIPFLLALVVVTLPLALVGAVLWLPCQSCRHPYIYSHDPGIETRQLHTDDLLQEPFILATMNLCLLPEALARTNNLADTNKRAAKISTILTQTNTSSDMFRDESVFDLKDSGNSSDLDRPGNLSPSVQNGKFLQRGEVSPLLINKTMDSQLQATEGLGAAAADILNGISAHEEGPWLKDCARSPRDIGGVAHLCVHHAHQPVDEAPHHPEINRKLSFLSGHAVCEHSLPVDEAGVCSRDVSIVIPQVHGQHGQAQCLDNINNLQVNIQGEENNSNSHVSCKEHRGRSQSESQSRSRNNSNRLSASASGESGIGSGSNSQRRCSNNRSVRNSSSASSSFLSHEDIFCHLVSDTFPPDIDFLCLQEVYDQRAGIAVVQKLHHQFPFILYDVGKYSLKCHEQKLTCSLLNSGLLFASRFPIEDAVFRHFKNCQHEDLLSAKGLLMVKVRLREGQGLGRGIIAFISMTHLQSGENSCSVRKTQLNQVQDWLAEFRQQNQTSPESSADCVAFDVLCGDLNFDNESTSDEECWSHSLMTHYQDPCRICQGKDKPWTVGTELNQQKLYDPEVDTPKGLKEVLSTGSKRVDYVHSVNVKEENVTPTSGSQGNGKRRVDYILYNLETTQTNLNVEEYHFVTQLSTLTDHLAVAMKFHVSGR